MPPIVVRPPSTARSRLEAACSSLLTCSQLVLICTGSTVVTRQTRTGAPTVRANPVATWPVSAASSMGPVALTVTRNLGRRGHHRARASQQQLRPGRQMPAQDERVRAAPGDVVLDPQPCFGQQPAAPVDGPAGQPPVPVMHGLGRQQPTVRDAGRQLRDPGPAGGPERTPHLGRVGAVNLEGVMCRGGSLVAADRARCVGGRAGVHQERHASDVHHAAERVRVGVGRQFIRAGCADVGQQAPASRGRPDEAGVRQDQQRLG